MCSFNTFALDRILFNFIMIFTSLYSFEHCCWVRIVWWIQMILVSTTVFVLLLNMRFVYKNEDSENELSQHVIYEAHTYYFYRLQFLTPNDTWPNESRCYYVEKKKQKNLKKSNRHREIKEEAKIHVKMKTINFVSECKQMRLQWQTF